MIEHFLKLLELVPLLDHNGEGVAYALFKCDAPFMVFISYFVWCVDNDGVGADMVMGNKLNQEGCLFVMFVTLKFPNLQHLVMLLVLLKNFQWVWVHQDGFVMIRPTMLLNVKLKIQLNSIKSKLWKKNWGNLLVQLISLWWRWVEFLGDHLRR
jgi:hypothetical protein